MPTDASADRRKRQACPLCGRPGRPEHNPFCSQGCRDRDLLNWLGDGYRVAGPPAEEGLDSNGEGPL
jgi:endogenous inhibitor of DNA gyrase (YacG/DUF329 family)